MYFTLKKIGKKDCIYEAVWGRGLMRVRRTWERRARVLEIHRKYIIYTDENGLHNSV